MLPFIDKVLDAQVALLHETRNFVRSSRKGIRIGTSPLIRAGWLVRMLEEFRKAHTDIEIILHMVCSLPVS
jgi:DNA-binding transcriptional LysR family regulator